MNRLPKIYLAGRIRKMCWRHKLVAGLREHSWDDGPLVQVGFEYIGPFLTSCDHGCCHGENTHGALSTVEGCQVGGQVGGATIERHRAELWSLCIRSVLRADLVFAFIEDRDCYGTIVEMTLAIDRGIPVVVAFAKQMPSSHSDDLWFSFQGADWIVKNVSETDLPDLLGTAIRRYT
jgi:hypothetical protein